jgi:hypothetical protein
MLHCGSPFCHQGHFETPSLPGLLLWLNVTSVLMAPMLVCDQKTFLSHLVGLQIITVAWKSLEEKSL